MIGPNKYFLFLFGASIATATLFSFNARAGEPENNDLFGKKLPKTEATVNVAVLDAFGNVHYTDVKTPTDAHIDYNLNTLPIGEYTVAVKLGDEVINHLAMSNVSSNPNVLTVEVLNEVGNQVYVSTNSKNAFDLEAFPNGEYTVNVFKGSKLINTQILMK